MLVTCSNCGRENPVTVSEFDNNQIHGVTKCLNEECSEYMEFKTVIMVPLGIATKKEENPSNCVLCNAPLGRRAGEWRMYCKLCAYKAKKEKLALELMQDLSQGVAYLDENRHEVHAKLLALARLL